MKKNKIILGLVALALSLFAMVQPMTVNAAKGDYGVDWSKYQGANGVFGYAHDKFAISQIGGYYNGYFVDQTTYPTQVQYTVAQGKRAHTYIYARFSSRTQADQMLNYYLPRVQTPKGSIVALDVEDGYPNTDAVLYALKRVQNAGYTAVLYGYKNFLVNHLDLATIANQYPLWLAEYVDYNVTPTPNYNYFPSFPNIGMFQFTSTYIAGGLDGNVDLTGITDNGYKQGQADKPKTQTPAVKAGITADNTPKSDIKAGYTVKVNFSAKTYATGQAIPGFVKGQPHEVLQVSGNKVLLADIYSWVNKSDVEILATNNSKGNVEITRPQGSSTNLTWTDSLGDKWHSEKGEITLNTPVNLRWGARVNSSKIATLPAGFSVKYDAWSRHGGYVWLRQPRQGGYGYLVCRDGQGNPFGTFK